MSIQGIGTIEEQREPDVGLDREDGPGRAIENKVNEGPMTR
ncbi:MAG TPA: hypothetical protein VFV24_02940 [Candidatus Eisenbacteria bacterium]|nr:hypothetical protein [Candidatus Eisenbacteria bacterium]